MAGTERVVASLSSPLGDVAVEASASGVCAVTLRGFAGASDTAAHVEEAHPWVAPACRQLREYFAGERREFEVAIDVEATDFQREVWSELQKIPYGETRSYGQIAEALGKPKAMRAVGLANGKNPIAILVPCHRVIGSSGALTGYAGGMDAKRWLLEHEGALAQRTLAL